MPALTHRHLCPVTAAVVATLQAATVHAQTTTNSPQQLPKISVGADAERDSYKSEGASSPKFTQPLLDTPRTGAGKDVVRLVAELGPRRMVYVACDPAALARDVRTAGEQGYSLVSLEAWDAFPRTHHVECIAVLEPTRP